MFFPLYPALLAALVAWALVAVPRRQWLLAGWLTTRFLLPAFTIVLPLALLAAKLPKRALGVLLPAGALGSAWYGAFLMTVATMNP